VDIWADGAVVPSVVMGLLVLGVAVLFLRPLMARIGRAVVRVIPDRPPTRFTADEIRRQAGALLDDLAAALSRTDPVSVDPDAYESAGLARTQAEQALDASATTDLVGALVLARCGLDDLATATGGGLLRYQSCFFNPLHEPATAAVSYALGHGAVDVPACDRCRGDLDAGITELDALPGDDGRPYFLGSDRWAVTGYGALVDDLPWALYRYERAVRDGTR
jgi:hypothetical protein